MRPWFWTQSIWEAMMDVCWSGRPRCQHVTNSNQFVIFRRIQYPSSMFQYLGSRTPINIKMNNRSKTTTYWLGHYSWWLGWWKRRWWSRKMRISGRSFHRIPIVTTTKIAHLLRWPRPRLNCMFLMHTVLAFRFAEGANCKATLSMLLNTSGLEKKDSALNMPFPTGRIIAAERLRAVYCLQWLAITFASVPMPFHESVLALKSP